MKTPPLLLGAALVFWGWSSNWLLLSLLMAVILVHPTFDMLVTRPDSAKGRDLQENPQAAMCFHWDELTEQVRVQGRVDLVSDDEAAQKAAAASTLRSHASGSPTSPEKTIGARTNPFFNHCSGRMARRSGVIRPFYPASRCGGAEGGVELALIVYP